LTFFSFRITRTSVNTDVLGRSPEVRVNEVLLYFVFKHRLSIILVLANNSCF